MGNIIATKCCECDFENKFSFGGGRFSYKTFCPVPAINKETLEFENINYFEHLNSNNYLFYIDVVLKGDNLHDKTITNFDLILNEENNYCPRCKTKALAFRVQGYID